MSQHAMRSPSSSSAPHAQSTTLSPSPPPSLTAITPSFAGGMPWSSAPTSSCCRCSPTAPSTTTALPTSTSPSTGQASWLTPSPTTDSAVKVLRPRRERQHVVVAAAADEDVRGVVGVLDPRAPRVLPRLADVAARHALAVVVVRAARAVHDPLAVAAPLAHGHHPLVRRRDALVVGAHLLLLPLLADRPLDHHGAPYVDQPEHRAGVLADAEPDHGLGREGPQAQVHLPEHPLRLPLELAHRRMRRQGHRLVRRHQLRAPVPHEQRAAQVDVGVPDDSTTVGRSETLVVIFDEVLGVQDHPYRHGDRPPLLLVVESAFSAERHRRMCPRRPHAIVVAQPCHVRAGAEINETKRDRAGKRYGDGDGHGCMHGGQDQERTLQALGSSSVLRGSDPRVSPSSSPLQRKRTESKKEERLAGLSH
ncbi:hypothetical protein PVAP13_2KG348173 [Panicum virgatum]|uniref:Uncharacterized protein n=1 Tax=Panicum virgatum TaxID=38727 RepID=A0A8T0W5Y9_PANVG|nr:hypothetical protein PVAP13_2KG348173 [Panicum virgatum]